MDIGVVSLADGTPPEVGARTLREHTAQAHAHVCAPRTRTPPFWRVCLLEARDFSGCVGVALGAQTIDERQVDGRLLIKKSKPRQNFNWQQLSILEQVFETDPLPWAVSGPTCKRHKRTSPQATPHRVVCWARSLIRAPRRML
jgi:hypothetical protein